jgi:hypothetical protein
MLRPILVQQGNFAVGEGNQGNFTTETPEGEQVFVSKKLLARLGITSDSNFKPFFANIAEKMINPRDEDGNYSTVAVARLQAVGVFATQADLVEASNASRKLTLAIAEDFNVAVKASTLSEEGMNAIMNVSF